MYRSKKQRLSFFGLSVAVCIVITASGLWAQTFEESLIQDLHWRNIGPANMAGRISDIEAFDDDFRIVMVASASGGVFKSTDAGTTWTPIFDKYGSASIGDVAFFQKDPDIIWVGTGEKNCRNSIAWGDGIYKSTDGGETFANMGLKDTHCIGRIITHPTDPDLVYVAASGHLWGYTGNRGLYKTTNGGRTWQKITNGLPDDGKTGAIELAMHPEDPDTLWVGFWQRLRRPWRFDSGGPNGGIFKTTDGGESWTQLTEGLPEGDTGKIGIAVSRSNPDVLMAMVEAERSRDLSVPGSGIYRSEDGGESWEYVNTSNNRPFYYSHIYINPFDDELVYVLTSNFQLSRDGGRTLERAGSGLHPDFHAMWLDPHDKDRYYIGNDGGAALTHDHGGAFVFFDNMCICQFYAVGADMRDPYYVWGGLQDNGTWGGPSNTREGSNLTDFWTTIAGGDGFHAQVDPTDWRTVYCESQGGSIQRINIETRESSSIRPNQRNIVNYSEYFPEEEQPPAEQAQRGQRGGRGGPFRFNWSSPIVMSPHNPRTIFFGGNHLFKTVDRGDHWKIISPDLSTNDPEKTRRDTGGLTPDTTGAETHCTIITISESPITPDLIWTGTDDGNVHITRNGGNDWINIRKNIPGVPEELWCSRVEASHFEEGTCYVTFDGHRSDNFNPWVFKTTDYGQTWENIGYDIPFGQCCYVIKEDLKNPNLLFLGTEFAVFYTIDGGENWCKMNLNLPTVAVHDLLIHPRDNDLIAATHGRGFWVLDDITALQQAAPEVLEADAHLFENRVATNWLSIRRGGSRGHLYFRGEDAPRGPTISYYLNEDVTGQVEFEITDIMGNKRTITVDAEPGIHRLRWDGRFGADEQQQAQRGQFAQRAAGGQRAQAGQRGAGGQQFITMITQRIEQAIEKTENRQQRRELRRLLDQVKEAGSDMTEFAELRTQIEKLIPDAFAGMFGAQRGQAAQRGAGGQRGGRGAAATPGEYGVKMTVNDQTYTSKITIRQDPILDGVQ